MFYEVYQERNGKWHWLLSVDTLEIALTIAEKLSVENPGMRYRVTHWLWHLLPLSF